MIKISRSLALALGLAIASAPAIASAEPPRAAEADGHFQRGVELFKEADYSAALIEFRRAHEIAPAYQVLYNIAETYYLLTNYAGALTAFEQYLADGGAKLPPDRRAEVEKEVQRLRLRVARVTVSSSPPGAEITVDDTPMGKTPLAQPLLVSAGRRRIVATRPGRPPAARLIDVAGGDAVEISFDIPDAPAAPQAAAPSTAPPAGPSAMPPKEDKVDAGQGQRSGGSGFIVAWAGTGALAVGAAITGGLALGASSDLRKKRGAFPADPAAIASAAHKTTALAAVSDALTATAVVLAGVSIYLTATRGDAQKAPATAIRAGVTPGGLRIDGTF